MPRRDVIALGVAIAAMVAVLGRVPAWAVGASLESDSAESASRVLEVNEGRVIDDGLLGVRTVLRAPRRIVSLTLASDVMLASLVDPGRVVGVTALVDDPTYSSASEAYPSSVARVTASAELLLALGPDLVVVSGYSHPATVRALVGARVPVLRLPSGRSLDEIRDALDLLARAVSAEERATPILNGLARDRAELQALPPLTPRPRVLFLAAGGFTHGAGTLTDELVRLAGADNVARERGLTGLVRIGAEVIAAARPDVIVVPAPTMDDARRTVASLTPGLGRVLDGTRVVAIPPSAIETTTPDAIGAAHTLRAALEAPVEGAP